MKIMTHWRQAALPEQLEKIEESTKQLRVTLGLTDSDLQEQLDFVCYCSDFAHTQLTKLAAEHRVLLAPQSLQTPKNLEDYRRELQHLLMNIEDEPGLMRILRLWRNQQMLRILWRDLCGYDSLETILAELSCLAESCLALTAETLQHWLQQQFGTPVNSRGESLQLITLGMGKLGGHELNFSSDIDVIFTFEEQGQTINGRRSLSNSEFFIRLSQKVMGVLDTTTEHGFVYRMDARLRPFGDAGQLALSFDALEDYYESHGRDWERYAFVKARVISGQGDKAASLMKRLQPFVYRRYLDYSAFESIREMKVLINAELKRKGMEQNLKLGPGGIREIEFITQAYQLIRGGRDSELQSHQLMPTLKKLALLHHLPDYAADRLLQAYAFLRQSENRIQAQQDKQTHLIPENALDRNRLHLSMGYADWGSYFSELNRQRTRVQQQFDQVFSSPQDDSAQPQDENLDLLKAVWSGNLPESSNMQMLQQAGFTDAQQINQIIERFRNSPSVRTLGPRGQARMQTLFPLLLNALARRTDALNCLHHLSNILEKIGRRTAYLALLSENPLVISQVINLVAVSPWIAEQLSQYPILLDELLDPETLYHVASIEDLSKELDNKLAHVDHNDEEQRMIVLREFRHSNVFRTAAAQLEGTLPVNKVSDQLSFIAETILQKVLAMSWEDLTARHGEPEYIQEGARQRAGFAIIAYGKLGGWELSFSSDLDLVFLHNSPAGGMTNGNKPLDNAMFFARLAQRIIHSLQTHMVGGVLYEVDTRLRPSGNSGLLVSSTSSFAEYQHQQAWTWEHQALVRARAICGDDHVIQQFADIRRDILQSPRQEDTLKSQVIEMREKMRKHLSKDSREYFDLKQGKGGITDIEFINQYCVLRWAHEHPQLCQWSDNLRIMDMLTNLALLPAEHGKLLNNSYLLFRNKLHELALAGAPATTDKQLFEHEREQVHAVWQSIFGTTQ